MIRDEYTAQEIARELAFEAAQSRQFLDFSIIRTGLIEAGVDPALYKSLEKTCFTVLLAEGLLEDTGEKTVVAGRSFNLFKSLIF
ncbi:MAG: hypothetical protein QE510_12235 [Verrucomicrobiota bacterium]|nr:hypothetical protein [Verrucomicrobiota bacterium]